MTTSPQITPAQTDDAVLQLEHDMVEIVRGALNIHERQAFEIAKAIVKGLRSRYGGLRLGQRGLYIPAPSKAERNQAVCREFGQAPTSKRSWPSTASSARRCTGSCRSKEAGIVSTAGFNVDNLEITTLDDGSLFVREEVLAGMWQNAEFWLFRYRWDVLLPTIANDVEVLMRGWLGEITLGTSTLTVELRGLKQKLQQSVGMVSQKTCRSRLGAVGLGQCNRDLADLTHAVEVVAVTDKRTFVIAQLPVQPPPDPDAQPGDPLPPLVQPPAFADDYLGEGMVTWVSGANKGLSQKVRTHTAAGVVTLVLPMCCPLPWATSSPQWPDAANG